MSQGSGEYIPLGRVPVLKVWIGFNCQSLYIFVPRSFFPFKRCFCLPCFFLVCERCKTSPTKILIRMGTPISNMDLPKGTLEMLHEKTFIPAVNSSRCKMASPICWWGFMVGEYPGIPELHGRLLGHPRLQGMEVMMRCIAGEWQGTLWSFFSSMVTDATRGRARFFQ